LCPSTDRQYWSGNNSKTLEKLVHGLSLQDACDSQQLRHKYTYYTPTGASRIDRVYITESLHMRKQGVETVPDAFTDHFAVTVRLSLETQSTRFRRGYWMMNTSMLHEQGFLAKVHEEWMRWKTHAKYHPNRVLWWDRYVKRMVRLTFQSEGTERRRDRVAMENYYYTVIQALQAPIDHVKKANAVRQLKAKIIRLHSQENQRILLANGESDKIIGEEVSVHST